MISRLLHLLGYAKYPLGLTAIVYLLKGGPKLKAAMEPGTKASQAPGADLVGVALIFAGLALSASALSDPDRDERVNVGSLAGKAVAVLLFLLGAFFVLFTPIAVLAGEVPLSHPLSLGTLTLGLGGLGESRKLISRNALNM